MSEGTQVPQPSDKCVPAPTPAFLTPIFVFIIANCEYDHIEYCLCVPRSGPGGEVHGVCAGWGCSGVECVVGMVVAGMWWWW